MTTLSHVTTLRLQYLMIQFDLLQTICFAEEDAGGEQREGVKERDVVCGMNAKDIDQRRFFNRQV